MAVVVAGMTLVQLAELAASLEGGVLTLIKIHDALKAEGKKDADPIPPEHLQIIKDAMAQIQRTAPQLSSDAFIERLGQ